MHVAIDIRNLLTPYLSGVGYYTCALVTELVKDASIEWYLYYNQGKYFKLPQEIEDLRALPNVHIIATRYPNKVLNLLLAGGLIHLDRVIEKHAEVRKFDCIVFPNLGFAHVSKRTRVLQVVHDMSFERFPSYYSWRMRVWHRLLRPKQMMRQAASVIVPSESAAHDVEVLSGVSKSKIHIIPHGRPREFQVQELKDRFELPEKFFVSISTIEPRKNFEGIVEAYKESGLHRQGIELVIGGGLGWRHRHIIELFHTTPGVRYLGYVTESEKRALLSRALGLVYPSFYEGFGLPILEAFALGTPVITSDCSSLPEVAGGAAYLVRPHMISDIAHALRDIALHPELSEFYRAKGKARLQDFSWEKSAEQVKRLLVA